MRKKCIVLFVLFVCNVIMETLFFPSGVLSHPEIQIRRIWTIRAPSGRLFCRYFYKSVFVLLFLKVDLKS